MWLISYLVQNAQFEIVERHTIVSKQSPIEFLINYNSLSNFIHTKTVHSTTTKICSTPMFDRICHVQYSKQLDENELILYNQLLESVHSTTE